MAPVPFEELLNPCVARARHELNRRFRLPQSLLADGALEDLEGGLVSSLSGVLSQALELEFSLFRAFDRARVGSFGKMYSRYAQKMADGELEAFWERYPLLETVAARLTKTWVDASAEFLTRLQNDSSAIQKAFGDTKDLGPLAGLQTNMSDRHNGGRTVWIARFSNGARVVYKPRDAGVEQIFHDLLCWLNSEAAALQLRVPNMLERPGYSWVEFIEHNSCADANGIRRYYQRAGELACLVFAVAGTDCHFGNVIASGEHPVLIDAETLFQPVVGSAGDAAPVHTVLATGLLPGSYVHGVDVSAFGVTPGAAVPFRVATWVHANTDAMAQRFVPGRLVTKSLPNLDGKVEPIWDYPDDVLNGFRQMYRMLLHSRKRLMAAAGPLERMRKTSIRFLVRDSLEYYRAINCALHLTELRGKKRWTFQLGELRGERAAFQPVTRFEESELALFDVPRFALRADMCDLIGPNFALANCFRLSGHDHVTQTLERLSEENLRQQTALIGALLSLMRSRENG